MFINGVYIDTFHWGFERHAYLSQMINAGVAENKDGRTNNDRQVRIVR